MEEPYRDCISVSLCVCIYMRFRGTEEKREKERRKEES